MRTEGGPHRSPPANAGSRTSRGSIGWGKTAAGSNEHSADHESPAPGGRRWPVHCKKRQQPPEPGPGASPGTGGPASALSQGVAGLTQRPTPPACFFLRGLRTPWNLGRRPLATGELSHFFRHFELLRLRVLVFTARVLGASRMAGTSNGSSTSESNAVRPGRGDGRGKAPLCRLTGRESTGPERPDHVLQARWSDRADWRRALEDVPRFRRRNARERPVGLGGCLQRVLDASVRSLCPGPGHRDPPGMHRTNFRPWDGGTPARSRRHHPTRAAHTPR